MSKNLSKYPDRSNYKRKSIKKTDFKKIVASLLILSGITYSGALINQKISNENKIDDLTNNLKGSIETIYNTANNNVLNGKEIINNDVSQSVYYSISKQLMKKYGVSRDLSFYLINDKYGKNAFDLVTQAYNYKDSDNFLYKEYPKFIDRSTDGKIVERKGSYKEFIKSMKKELLNNYDNLADFYNYNDKVSRK